MHDMGEGDCREGTGQVFSRGIGLHVQPPLPPYMVYPYCTVVAHPVRLLQKVPVEYLSGCF